jgi:hypothetical protein
MIIIEHLRGSIAQFGLAVERKLFGSNHGLPRRRR